MACGFCATGQAGFDRHLTTGEIVEQVVRRPPRGPGAGGVSNVVFMGMGEPLANYDAHVGRGRALHDDLGLSARHLTRVDGRHRARHPPLAGEPLPVTLAVSLHAANDALRDELVPINRRYPLDEPARGVPRVHRGATGRRLSLRVGDDRRRQRPPSDAGELAALAGRLRAHVNLIPLNPTPGYPTPGTPPDRVQAFRDQLRAGVNATVRRTRARTSTPPAASSGADHEPPGHPPAPTGGRIPRGPPLGPLSTP